MTRPVATAIDYIFCGMFALAALICVFIVTIDSVRSGWRQHRDSRKQRKGAA